MNFFDMLGASQPKVPKHPTAQEETEARIDRICRALGIDPTQVAGRAHDDSPLPASIIKELQAGRKIDAVKAYREWADVGLKEAKDAIDAVEAGGLPNDRQESIVLHAKLDAILAKVESDR